MKKTVRKLISVLLVSVMLLTMAPLSGFMGISLPTVDWDKLFTPKASAATNGTCGENLTWTLDDEGTLTISGTGFMDEFYWSDSSPWYDDCSLIKKVIVEDGVESIGENAFNGCTSLEEVNLPDSLWSIGDEAFSGCRSLTSIEIPDGVSYIDPYAFEYCSSLVSVNLPDKLSYIGDGVFSYCYSLKEIEFPEFFNDFEYSIFYNSYIERVSVDSNNENYAAKDGVLFNREFTELIYYPKGKTDTSYIIPDSVTKVGYDAFTNEHLTEITVPYSVTTICDSSFCGSYSLTKLIFANSDCEFESSFSTDSFPAGVTVYGYENSKAQLYAEDFGLAFEIYNCDHSQREFQDKELATCIKDGHEAGIFCHTCGASVEGYELLPALNMSVGCTDKNDDDICDFCAVEREVADSGECGDNLTWKLYTDGLLRIFGTGDMWDYGIAESVEYTGPSYSTAPWAGLVKRLSIENVIIEDGVTGIGFFSFAYCRNIENVYIADSVTSIRAGAFIDCSVLENVYFSNDSELKTIQYRAFSNCDSLKAIIPDSVTEIGMGAFESCNLISEITIPADLVTIGDGAFYGCPLENITVDSKNKMYSSENGVLYDKAKKSLILYPQKKKDTVFSVPETVKSIAVYAFKDNGFIESVYIPASVFSIGESAFYDCSELTSVTFGTGSKLQVISELMFRYCDSLESIEIPYGVTTISDYAFEYCYSLSEIHIPDTVKTIGRNAFDSTSLLDIVIPYSVKMLYADAFAYTEIQKITIANPDCEIAGDTYAFFSEPVISGYENSTAEAFAENYGLTFEVFECDHSEKKTYSVKSPTCETDGRTAGEGCPVCGFVFSGLETIPALNPGNLCVDGNADEKCDLCEREITVLLSGNCGDNAFWTLYDNYHMRITGTGEIRGSDITSIFMGISVPEFMNNGLNMVVQSLSVEEGITKIGDAAFMNFITLKTVSLPDSLESIGAVAFMGCTELLEVIIPDSVIALGIIPFAECVSLSHLHIGNGVNYADVFLSFMSLSNDFERITVSEDNQYFCDIDGSLYSKDKKVLYIYADAENRATFTVPEGVTAIFDAFANCSELTSITIPDSVESMGSMFENCPKLTDIIVNENNNTHVSIDGVLYTKDKKCLVKYPAGKTDKAFTVPDGVEYISSYAFSDCTYLETVTISDSVKDIGTYAFSGCTSLSDIKFSGNSQLESIGADAFNNTAYFDDDNNWVDGVLYIEDFIIDSRYLCDTEYYVKDGTKVIADNALAWSSGVESIYIPYSVTSIGSGAFRGYYYDYSLSEIIVDENNENYRSEDGVLYNKDKTELVCYPSGKTEASFTVPDSVTSIADYAFYSCKNLTDITVGDNVQQIGTYAFENSYYAADMSNWEDGMLYVGNHLIGLTTDIFGFSDISGDFIIKEGTKTIADQVISLVKEPVNITLPESLSYISCYNLSSVLGLESITVLNPDCIIDDAEMFNQMVMYYNLDMVVYGYNNSTAEEFADIAGVEFVALDGTDECDHKLPEEWTVTTEPAIGIPGSEFRKCLNCDYTEEREIPALELIITDDEDSNIGISDTDGAFDAEDGNVSVEIKKDATVAQYVLTDFSRMSSWNITFRNENGEEIQPSGPVTVRMPIPSDFNRTTLMVMHIDPETSDAEFVPFTIEDGYAVFIVSDFSIYVLVDTSSEKEDITPEEPDEPEEPETPDDSCSHMCHKDGFLGFIWKIINFFQKLFGINSVCECGERHY